MTEGRRITIHQLKSWPEPFTLMAQGKRHVELRKETDRHFNTYDLVMFEEFDPDTDTYTGRHRLARITHIMRNDGTPWGTMLAPDVVALSVRVFREPRSI